MKLQKKKGLKQNDFMRKFWQNNLAKIKVRQNGGITLIALIISIIVMLILAGVSLSAIVGDNGILTQAQNATYQSSIATLEEYMQELYVTNYDEFANSSSKLEGLLLDDEYKNYFYIPKNEGVGGLSYIVDSEGHALYLIKKSNLPDEIKNQIQDGNAGDGNYSDYLNLNDVYGITTDLKVYYCSNGADSIMGIAKEELDEDNPLREVFTSSKNSSLYSLLSSYDQDGNGTLSAEECKSIKSLTIDSSSNITSFTDFYNLISLQEIIFDGVNLTDLKGLQNCSQLNYVYFKSSTVADYSSLSGISKLKYLYLYDIDDNELTTLCNGIKDAEFSQLEYLAVVGNNQFISSIDIIREVTGYTPELIKKITSLTPLSILSTTTKNAIRYLSIQCNDIEGDLKAIAGFTNLYLLRCEYNNLTSLDGLENMSSLALLCGAGNKLGTLYDSEGNILEFNNTDNISTESSIKSLANKPKLEQVYLVNNSDLTNVDYFENDTAIGYLYLAGCSKNMNVNGISSIILGCKVNYSLPVKFLSGTVYNVSDYYTPSEVTYAELSQDLLNNTIITHLNLEGCTSLTNDELNTILKSMTSLQYLTLKDNTTLTSIDFIANDGVTGLIELDLRNTNAQGEGKLSNLNTYATKLMTLRVSDGSDFKNIVDTINRLKLDAVYWNKSNSGLTCSNIEAFKCLENLSGLISLKCQNWAGNNANYIGSSSTYIDFRNTNLKDATLNGVIGRVYLPATIQYYYSQNCCLPILAESSISLTELSLSGHNNDFEVKYKQEAFESFKNAQNLEFLNLGNLGILNVKSLSEYINFDLLKVTDLDLSSDDILKSGFLDLKGIEYFPNLETLKLNYTPAILDVSAFSSDAAIAGVDRHLTTLTLTNANINLLTGLENLTALTDLTLNNNSISNLKPLENLTNLQTLDLSNNVISDTASYTDSNGATQTVNNLQILANLNKNAGKGGSLTSLYLAGNSNIVDFTPVSSLSWSKWSGF